MWCRQHRDQVALGRVGHDGGDVPGQSVHQDAADTVGAYCHTVGIAAVVQGDVTGNGHQHDVAVSTCDQVAASVTTVVLASALKSVTLTVTSATVTPSSSVRYMLPVAARAVTVSMFVVR